MKTASVSYLLKMEYCEYGDIVSIKIRDKEFVSNGEVLFKALDLISEADFNLQEDLSKAFDEKYPGHIHERIVDDA